MGGYRRPLCFRTVCSCLLQNHLVRLWCVYTTPLELTLPKISEKIQSLRPAAVPPSGTAPPQNNLLLFFFFAPRFFPKRKRQFSARLCSDEQDGGASRTTRGQKISSLLPPPFFARSIDGRYEILLWFLEMAGL